MSTCADFIAAVDQLHVGDWSLDSAPSNGAACYGQLIRTNSKAQLSTRHAAVLPRLRTVGLGPFAFPPMPGHRSPTSTLHYLRIRPTQLAAAFVKAD
jgi:hypothetical protein